MIRNKVKGKNKGRQNKESFEANEEQVRITNGWQIDKRPTQNLIKRSQNSSKI